MGWFWADEPQNKANSVQYVPSASLPSDSSCPRHNRRSRGCPVDHSSTSFLGCPRHGNTRQDRLNPRNNMPDLPNSSESNLLYGSVSLPTTRESSTIPMNADGELWQYPSPQQMLNAMARKGYEGTNPEDVPAMVAVHNWLNEGSWEQILEWEKKYFPENTDPWLVKFNGRPGKPTPKSYFLSRAGLCPRAFDHHEWYVSTPDGKTRRYVLDYYDVDDLTFSVDVRPAVDDFGSFRARMQKFAEDMKSRISRDKKGGE